MKSFFEGIQYFFEEILFIPMDFLAKTELENWWIANVVSWLLVIICCCAMIYWLKQLKFFKDNNQDYQDTTAHSFLE